MKQEEPFPSAKVGVSCELANGLKLFSENFLFPWVAQLEEDALQLDKHRFFRHNSGITGKTFPDYNPYTIQRCRDCDIAKGKLKLAKPSNEVCEACQTTHEYEKRKRKSDREIERRHYLDEMSPLLNKKVKKNNNGKEIIVSFSNKGNKHLISDTFKFPTLLKKTDLATIDKLLERATYVKTVPFSKPKRSTIKEFHYYKTQLHNKTIYLNVAHKIYKNNGEKVHSTFLYAISDRMKK